MRVRLGRITAGDPPSLLIEADTQDDTVILDAIAGGQHTHRATFGSGYNCHPAAPGKLVGTVELILCWFPKEKEAAPNGG